MQFIIKTCELCEQSALPCRSKLVLLAASSSAESLAHFQAACARTASASSAPSLTSVHVAEGKEEEEGVSATWPGRL